MKQNIIHIETSGENMTPIIRDVLEGLQTDCENVISFKKGEYRFFREGSVRRMLYSSGGKSV